MNPGDIWCPNCMTYHASLTVCQPKAKPAPVQSAEEFITYINHCKTVDSLREIIESRDAAQCQAGREEERAIVEELRNDDRAFMEERYDAVVEALRNNLRDIERLNEFAHRNGLPAFDLMEEETRKALSDLDEARK